MGQLIKFRARITPKTVDNLLDEASEIHPYVRRLKAMARHTYGEKSEDYQYVNTYLTAFESYLNNSTYYHEAVQDEQADLSITGNLPIELMEKRYEMLGQRIAAYKAKKMRRIIALPVEGRQA
jgi:hypothetical protein